MTGITASPATRGQPGQPADPPRSILVVDDEPAIVEVLCLLLEDEGFEVIGETNPVEAVHTIRREQPSLILTDVMMPGMTGYELASLASSIDPNVQVVFMSAVVESWANRGHPFLAKPFDLAQVIDLVEDHMRAS